MASNAVARALAIARAFQGRPVNAPLGLGYPYQGTHTLGNWESDRAVDISTPIGTPVYAVGAGTIGQQFGPLDSANPRMAGLRLHLNTPEDAYYYAHLSRFAPGIEPGVKVQPGEILGYSGEAAGVPHLHFAEESGLPQHLWSQPYHPGQATGVETQPYDPATQAPVWQPQQQGMFTPGQTQFIGRYAQQTGLDPRVVAAEVLNEESGSAARQRQQAGIHNWLNIGYTDTGERGTGNPVWRDPFKAATASANWIKGRYDVPGFGRASGGVQGILRSAGRSPAEQIRAIQQSGWASSGYPNLPSVYQSVGGKLSSPVTPAPPAALAQVGPPVVGNPPQRPTAAPQANVASRIRSGIVTALLAHGGQMNPQTLLNVALNARRGR